MKFYVKDFFSKGQQIRSFFIRSYSQLSMCLTWSYY